MVVRSVPARQLANDRQIGRRSPLWSTPASRSLRSSRHRELENRPPRFAPRDPIAAVDEDDDRLPYLFVGAEEAVVDPELTAAVADNNRAITCQPDAVLRAESKPL